MTFDEHIFKDFFDIIMIGYYIISKSDFWHSSVAVIIHAIKLNSLLSYFEIAVFLISFDPGT